jgi:hypothetical protein
MPPFYYIYICKQRGAENSKKNHLIRMWEREFVRSTLEHGFKAAPPGVNVYAFTSFR